MALHTLRGGVWERTGGPRPPQRSSRYERRIHKPIHNGGSHMPIDTGWHWTWRNPLNVIPFILLLITLVGLFGTVLTLI